ncbi:MAG TPA: flagellar hook-associated protein FlgL [Alphaproteobacteria bacterium]|nr:flagellar hook-associated protein FlgL [Alphaproteobacteria bacterium]
MRISSKQIQQVGIDSILNQQSRLSETQRQVASGNRILKPSDDPVGTSELMNLRKSTESTKQYQENAKAAKNRLTTEEGVLQGVTNLLQRTRELAVKGANGSQTNETRGYIAAEVRQRIDELAGLANSKDGAGDYLFSGGKGTTKPFVEKAGGGYQYQGDQTARELQIGAGRRIADGDAGSEVFQLIRNGNGSFMTEPDAANTGTGVIQSTSVVDQYQPVNTAGNNGYTIRFLDDPGGGDEIRYELYETDSPPAVPGAWPPAADPDRLDSGTYVQGEPIEYTAGGFRVEISGRPDDGDTFEVKASENQDIFTTLENLASALEQPVHTATQHAELENAVNRSIEDIDQGLDNVMVVRSSLGARLNAVESQEYVNDDYLLQSQEIMSSIEDLDYAEAVTRLNMQMAGLDAAQKAYMKVQGLSMFNYLRP